MSSIHSLINFWFYDSMIYKKYIDDVVIIFKEESKIEAFCNQAN